MTDDTEALLREMGEGKDASRQCGMLIGHGGDKKLEFRRCRAPAAKKFNGKWYCNRHLDMVRPTVPKGKSHG